MLRKVMLAGCLSLLLAPMGAGGQERPRVTVDDAVRLSLRENPTLRAKQSEVQSVRASEITAGLRPNPTASYSGEGLAGSQSPAQHTLIVGQTIELGGKRERRIESARAASKVTGFELADVRRQVVAQVKKSFVDVLTAAAQRTLAADNLRTLDEIERIQRFRAERGDISELELLRLQVQRFSFERDASDAELAMRSAKIALRAAIGPTALPEDFDVVGDLAFREVPLDREAATREAVANRPDLRAADAAREKARADVNLARANAWWDVTPQLEYQRSTANENTFGLGVSLPIRIFDRNQGEIARTESEVLRAGSLREAAAAQALAEVETAVTTGAVQRDRVRLLVDVYLPKALRARDTVEFAYRRGGVSLLDFLDAQRTYRETALEHLRALGAYWGAVYQLEAAVGRPVE
ncbi:MAG: TolC family protein [Candidatus Rokubacteria bacterium]|nr:TolC family protein [Candidatus Rokubacteria bacterium]